MQCIDIDQGGTGQGNRQRDEYNSGGDCIVSTTSCL